MKNIHKKISAIILAGMVVSGGVVASGVSSFANSVNINQQQQNDDVEEVLKEHLRLYDYRIKGEYDSKEAAKEAALKYKGRKKVYGGVRSLNDKNIDKLLYKLWSFNYQIVAIEYKGRYFVIGLDY